MISVQRINKNRNRGLFETHDRLMIVHILSTTDLFVFTSHSLLGDRQQNHHIDPNWNTVDSNLELDSTAE